MWAWGKLGLVATGDEFGQCYKKCIIVLSQVPPPCFSPPPVAHFYMAQATCNNMKEKKKR